ncbi:MAG: hypothetical protein ACRD5G_06330 [Candidatus Acidiferrales bacterium]
MLWDEATIEVLVRGTARLSVTLFLVWLLRQGWLRWRGGLDTRAARRQRNLFVIFAGVHVVHLAFVLLLAQVTQGESIRARGGWLLVTLTGGVIYLAIVVMALAHLGWIPGAARIRASRGAEIAATTLVWVAFMQAYTGRVLISAWYAPVPILLTIGILVFLLQHLRSSARAPQMQAPGR